MRFAKRKETTSDVPSVDESVIVRRMKVLGRGRRESDLYPEPDMRVALDSPRVKQVFWTPDELNAEEAS